MHVVSAYAIAIVISRFLERPQKQSRRNQLIHRRLAKTKSIGSGQDPESGRKTFRRLWCMGVGQSPRQFPPRHFPVPFWAGHFPRTIPPYIMHTYIYMYAYIHIYIHTYVHTYTVYTHIHIHTYTCIHIPTYIYRHTYIYICMYLCEYTMHVCMHTYMYKYAKICQYI